MDLESKQFFLLATKAKYRVDFRSGAALASLSWSVPCILDASHPVTRPLPRTPEGDATGRFATLCASRLPFRNEGWRRDNRGLGGWSGLTWGNLPFPGRGRSGEAAVQGLCSSSWPASSPLESWGLDRTQSTWLARRWPRGVGDSSGLSQHLCLNSQRRKTPRDTRLAPLTRRRQEVAPPARHPPTVPSSRVSSPPR